MSPPDEFRALYEAHFDFVWRSLRRLGVRDADVMDQTQRVFLTAHFKFAEFEGRSRVSTWLFGICRHLASDYRRSAPVRREVATDAAELDLVLAQRGADGLGSQAARAALAETLLDKLPEPQRVVFVLFELEEMSGDEIAELLEVSVGTVRSRLRLAREGIRRHLKRLPQGTSSVRKEAVG